MKNSTLTTKKFLSAFQDIKLPWFLLLLAVIGSVINYIFTLELAALSADVVNASGDVEQTMLYGYIAAGLAMVTRGIAPLMKTYRESSKPFLISIS